MSMRIGSVVVAAGALVACGSEAPSTADRSPASVPVSLVPPSVTVPPASVPPSAPPGTLDLDDLPPESVPMGLTAYLSDVAFWVHDDVGDEISGGSRLIGDGTLDVRLQLFGTDVDRIEAALDEFDPDERERFEIVEVEHSLRELEAVAGEVETRLTDAGIDGSPSIRFGLDAVAVTIVTSDGEPAPDLEAAVTDLLGDLPVVIEFGPPFVTNGVRVDS